jgi:cytochrome c
MMRVAVCVLTLFAAAALTASCTKPSTSSESAASASTETPSAPPAPAILTPDQTKALLAALPAPFSGGDVEVGKARFVQCAACHTITKGGPNLTGPNLYGVFGRKAGSVSDFSYSDGVKAAGFTWDAKRIDTWITAPSAMIPGTKMSFVGLKDPKDRIDVIAYLKTATSPAP